MMDDVLEGKDGWLFLKGGSNNMISYYLEPDKFDSHIINAWQNLLNKRFNLFKEKGIEYVHLFVPNKLSVYSEYAGIDLVSFNSHPIRALMDSISAEPVSGDDFRECIINPISFYQQEKKRFLLYWKTDTHWTFWGCYCSYVLICEKLGVSPNHDLMNRNFGEAEIIMDLGGKLVPPVKEKARFYNVIKNSKRVYANDLVTYKEKNRLENDVGLHVGSHVIYKNRNTPNNQKVVLFGDSFSEYRPHLLTGLLAETFKEVHYIWSTSIDFEYIWSQEPDIVITEIVERFMPQVPVDNFCLIKYVKNKLPTTEKTFVQMQLDKLYNLKQYLRHRNHVEK